MRTISRRQAFCAVIAFASCGRAAAIAPSPIEANVDKLRLTKRTWQVGEGITGSYRVTNRTDSYQRGNIYVSVFNMNDEVEDTVVKLMGLDAGLSITISIEGDIAAKSAGSKRLEVSAAYDSDSKNFKVIDE